MLAAEDRVYDSAAELAFAAQRLRRELERPEADRVLAPVLGCVEEALANVAAALASADVRSAAAAAAEAARRCEQARRAAAGPAG